jgi:hypothetical protein
MHLIRYVFALRIMKKINKANEKNKFLFLSKVISCRKEEVTKIKKHFCIEFF